MKPQFRETALVDLEQARDFYEEQETGLGAYFLSRMEEEYVELCRGAGSHKSCAGFHRFVTRRFHHLIFYRMEAETPVIYAVLDGRRDPAYNQRKLKRF